MQLDFKSEMTKRTDEELIKILTVDKENYLPEAFIAAEEEFKKRNLSEEKASDIATHLAVIKGIELKKANEPLDISIKILTLLFPMVLTFILSGFFKTKGYDRKANQLATWTFLGFGLYIVIFIITTLA